MKVAGWHLHFLTTDRNGGGHVLGCGGHGLEASLQDLDDLPGARCVGEGW